MREFATGKVNHVSVLLQMNIDGACRRHSRYRQGKREFGTSDHESSDRRVLWPSHGRGCMSAHVKVFGCRPMTDSAANAGAGVGKAPREETAGRDTLAGSSRAMGI